MEQGQSFHQRLSSWNNGIPTCKISNLDTYPTFFTKTNSKWIRDLKHEKHKTVKLPDDNIGENADGLGYRNDLDITPQVYSKKERVDKLGFINITSVLPKILSRDWESNQQTGGKYLQKIKDYYPQYANTFLKFNNKKLNNPIKKWAKDINNRSPKKIYGWKISTRRDTQHFISLGKCRLTQHWDTTARLLEWATFKPLTASNADEDME